jgi:hypothetical protein
VQLIDLKNCSESKNHQFWFFERKKIKIKESLVMGISETLSKNPEIS